jgi:peroxiredoxin Q/BCP
VDSQFSNKAYAEQIGVTFPLLSDFTRETTTKYGIMNPEFPVAHRTTFVIDKNGVIEHIDREAEALDPNNAHAACSLLEHRKEQQHE